MRITADRSGACNAQHSRTARAHTHGDIRSRCANDTPCRWRADRGTTWDHPDLARYLERIGAERALQARRATATTSFEAFEAIGALLLHRVRRACAVHEAASDDAIATWTGAIDESAAAAQRARRAGAPITV